MTSTSPITRYLNWLAYAIIVYACIPNRVFAHIRYGIDASWQFSLNTAIKNGTVFGKDFVFTYGPLGYLATSLPLYTSGIFIILYKALLFGGLASIGIYAFHKSKTASAKVFVVLAFMLMGRLYYYESSLYYMALFIAAILLHAIHQMKFILFSLAFFAGLNFFIKLNTGMVLLFCLLLYLIGMVLKDRTRWKLGLFTIVFSIFSILIIAILTHTDLLLYIKNGLQIVRYYQDAVVLPVGKYSGGLLLSICILLGYLLFFGHLSFTYSSLIGVWLFCGLISLCLFISFKQGFLRGSGDHQVAFFAFALLVALIMVTFLSKLFPSDFYILFGWMILCLSSIAIINIGIIGFTNRPLKDLYAREPEPVVPIPTALLTKIGHSTVDIFPLESMHLYYHKLNYIPRPSPQGYLAYTDFLDSMNASHFESARAPRFVLMKEGSIDIRHPFWDEFRTKLNVRQNYSLVDSGWIAKGPGFEEEKYWLLKSKSFEEKTSVRFVEISSWTQPTKDSIYCKRFQSDDLLKIEVDYNLKGKLSRTFFQPPLLRCKLRYSNGEIRTYEAILPILSAGVPVGRRLEDSDDIRDFFIGGTAYQHNRLVSIQLIGNFSEFNSRIRLTLLRPYVQQQ